MKFLLFMLLLEATATWKVNATRQDGDGGSGLIECGGVNHALLATTHCTDNDRINVFQFDSTENRCVRYSVCPSTATDVMFATRAGCELVCPATECALPGHVDNGISYITRSHDGIVTAHYACFNSYNIIGSLERTCLYNGSWTGTEPYCQLTGVVCDKPEDVVGAYKEYSCTSPGCLVVYACNEAAGYQRIEGMGYRKCGEDGHWINKLPTCTRLRVMQDESEVSDEIKATRGQRNFEVRCIVEPDVPQSSVVRWTRVGMSGVNGNSHWLSDNKSLALSFDTVNENDAGKYKCILDGQNMLERSVEFVVITPMPTVTLLSKYPLIFPSVIMLTCIFEAKTKPSVEWFKDGVKLTHGNDYFMSDKTLTHPQINFNVLEIYNTEHLGSYYCEANHDNSTQEWFLLQQSAAHSKRSVTTEKDENELSTFDNICKDVTTGVYVGRIKRKVRGYALNIQRQLYSMGGFDNNNELLYINDEGLLSRHLSLNRLYLFVVHNSNTNSKPSLVAFYPYTQGLESIMSNACDPPSGFSN